MEFSTLGAAYRKGSDWYLTESEPLAGTGIESELLAGTGEDGEREIESKLLVGMGVGDDRKGAASMEWSGEASEGS